VGNVEHAVIRLRVTKWSEEKREVGLFPQKTVRAYDHFAGFPDVWEQFQHTLWLNPNI
jgi:hypothetical protein